MLLHKLKAKIALSPQLLLVMVSYPRMQTEWASDPLELELWPVVNHPKWALGTELGSSVRTAEIMTAEPSRQAPGCICFCSLFVLPGSHGAQRGLELVPAASNAGTASVCHTPRSQLCFFKDVLFQALPSVAVVWWIALAGLELQPSGSSCLCLGPVPP